MRHLALVAALCTASAAQGETALTFNLAQGMSAVHVPHRVDLGIAAAFDMRAERSSPGRNLALEIAGDLDGGGDTSGSAALTFADRRDGRIAAFDLSHHRVDEGGFDPGTILSAPNATTRGRFELGHAAGGPTDWALSGAFLHEDSADRDATGRQLSAEAGVSLDPTRRIALRLGHEQRSLSGEDATYHDLGIAVQVRRPRGRDESRVSARTTPDGVRVTAGIAANREMPRGSALGVEVGLAKTAEGAVLPVADLDLRVGLTRQSRITLEAGHHVIDDPLRGEIGDLRIDLRAHHRPTRLTTFEFGIGAFRRDPLEGGVTDSGVRAAAQVSRALTRNWSLTGELEHRRVEGALSSDGPQSEVSIMLERKIEAVGF